jgi:hypothetical protein
VGACGEVFCVAEEGDASLGDRLLGDGARDHRVDLAAEAKVCCEVDRSELRQTSGAAWLTWSALGRREFGDRPESHLGQRLKADAKGAGGLADGGTISDKHRLYVWGEGGAEGADGDLGADARRAADGDAEGEGSGSHGFQLGGRGAGVEGSA